MGAAGMSGGGRNKEILYMNRRLIGFTNIGCSGIILALTGVRAARGYAQPGRMQPQGGPHEAGRLVQ